MQDEQQDPDIEFIHALQYGAPEEAAQKLRERDQRSAVDRLAADELARSHQALTRFRTENTDIANDDAAEAVVERKVFNAYLADLKAAGFDESTIPPNLNAIAGLHLKLRASGHPKARKIDDIFAAAKDDYHAWRGGAPSGPVHHHMHGTIFGSDAEGAAINQSRSAAVEAMQHRRLLAQGRGTVDPRVTPVRKVNG